MCPIADSAKTLQASFSLQTMMELCGLSSPTTKKFLRRLSARLSEDTSLSKMGFNDIQDITYENPQNEC